MQLRLSLTMVYSFHRDQSCRNRLEEVFPPETYDSHREFDSDRFSHCLDTVMSTAAHPADKIVCYCLGVTVGDIEPVVIANPLANVRDVMDQTGAGTGCTACHCALQQMLGGQCPAVSASPICVMR